MAEGDQHRLSRRDLRAPDEFQELTGHAANWAREHQQLVIGVAAVAAAVLSLVAVVLWRGARSATAASARLATAQTMLAERKFAEVGRELDGLVEQYPRTTAGRLGLLYRGHVLLAEAKYAEAVAAYEGYLASGPSTTYLRQAALLGLGRAAEGSGDTAAAGDAYRRAAEQDGPYGSLAQLELAAVETKSGRTDAAATILKEILASPEVDEEMRAVVVARLASRPAEVPAGQ